MSFGDQLSPQRSVDPPYVCTESVVGHKSTLPRSALCAPPKPIFTDLSLAEAPAVPCLRSTSTRTPSIVALAGIEKPYWLQNSHDVYVPSLVFAKADEAY